PAQELLIGRNTAREIRFDILAIYIARARREPDREERIRRRNRVHTALRRQWVDRLRDEGRERRANPHARLYERGSIATHPRDRRGALLVALAANALAQGRYVGPGSKSHGNPDRLRPGRPAFDGRTRQQRRRLPHRPTLLLLPQGRARRR